MDFYHWQASVRGYYKMLWNGLINRHICCWPQKQLDPILWYNPMRQTRFTRPAIWKSFLWQFLFDDSTSILYSSPSFCIQQMPTSPQSGILDLLLIFQRAVVLIVFLNSKLVKVMAVFFWTQLSLFLPRIFCSHPENATWQRHHNSGLLWWIYQKICLFQTTRVPCPTKPFFNPLSYSYEWYDQLKNCTADTCETIALDTIKLAQLCLLPKLLGCKFR